MHTFAAFLDNLWLIILESAPWLLLGFLLAGIINQWIPKQWITRFLGRQGIGSIFRASLLGAPLPLCSCGIIPTAMGVRRAGASRGATTSFLVSTPETGVDSVSLTYALMGPVMAIARPVAAIISGVVSGLLVESLTYQDADTPSQTEKTSCCGGKKKHTTAEATSVSTTLSQRGWLSFVKIAQFSFGKLFNDIIYWLVIGLIGAALVKTFVPADFFVEWGSGLLAMLVIILLGIPMYICATASTPLAASLMLMGISPGVALVFMLVGPATNIATLGMVRNELSAKALFAYLSGVIGSAVVLGSVLDLLVAHWQINLALSLTHDHTTFSALSMICGVILIGLTLRAMLPKTVELFRKNSHA